MNVGPSLDGLDGLSFLINSPPFSPFFFFFMGKSKIEEQGRCDLSFSFLFFFEKPEGAI